MADSKRTLRLVVLGDSTTFTTDRGPLLPGDPSLYPNVLASELADALGRPASATVIASPGGDVRWAWRAVTKDRHVQFDVLMGADAVVVALGSFDHAPAGVPPVLEAVVPFLRPTLVRHRVRRALHLAHPWGVWLTRGRFTRTPAGEFARLFSGLLLQVRALTQGAPGVVLGPTSHRAPYYGFLHPQRHARERLQLSIAGEHGFPAVPCWPLVEPHRARLNPDGIHWPPDVHAQVARALAGPLLAQFRGEIPRPSAPDFDPPESVAG